MPIDASHIQRMRESGGDISRLLLRLSGIKRIINDSMSRVIPPAYLNLYIMNMKRWYVLLIALFFMSCESQAENTETSSIQLKTKGVNSVGIIDGRWLALGDSDFDSYQSDDLLYRVNMNASNASCVLSPIEIQAKDGRDFGDYAAWDDGRRHDYRGNFSLSGDTVRDSLFGWREHIAEDAKSGAIEMIRELRDELLGGEQRLGKAIISELKANSLPSPSVVQINIGINDIDGNRESMYEKFSSQESHFSWIDRRTGAIKKLVDKMLEIHPHIVIVLWQLLDDSRWNDEYSSEDELKITAHTDHWNSNLQEIADSHSTVVVFEANTFTEEMMGRKSDGTSKDIVIDGVKYIRSRVPDSTLGGKVDNTKYIVTKDGHGNTILSVLYTREIYRLLNDTFGAGIPPFSLVKINSLTCQIDDSTSAVPVLEIPADVVIKLAQLPYSIGKIVAHDSNGKNISDSAVAVSDRGGSLFGDGQGIQLRSPRHDRGVHHITVTVQDANGLKMSKSMSIVIE